jgi:hypothetical protein
VAILAKTLASAVAVTGVVASQDLAVMARSLTLQVISSSDPSSQVTLQGSLDNVNFFGMGSVTGSGQIAVDEEVVQYVRANVLKLASGTVTAYCSWVSG